jgi:TP53 regulating kinase-like protein
MAALAEEEDAPTRDHWSLLSQGAEARVYSLDLCGFPAVAKHRHHKNYRIAALDTKLRRDRTLGEARALARCRARGVPAPAVLSVDAARSCLYLERVAGPTAKAFVDAHRGPDPERVEAVLSAFGGAVAQLHAAGLVHGDLTTSNAIVSGPSGVVLIDFGLAVSSAQTEDRAVDLYVLERALASTHRDADGLVETVLGAYASEATDAKQVLRRLIAVRARGRKRECFG